MCEVSGWEIKKHEKQRALQNTLLETVIYADACADRHGRLLRCGLLLVSLAVQGKTEQFGIIILIGAAKRSFSNGAALNQAGQTNYLAELAL